MFQIPKLCNFIKVINFTGGCNLKKNVRWIMSKSFQCQQDWDKRLSSNVLSSIDSGELFRNLKKASDEKGFISSLDIDILINKMSQIDESSYDLIEKIIYNYRHTSEATGSLASTSHALIRTLLHANDHPRLMNILADKVNYGIFLDDYTGVLLLDHFLETDRINEGLQVVIDLMLQEELWQHALIHHLSYTTLHRHLHRQDALSLTPLPTIPKNLDIVYRKVKYIQNPYYDEHFDLYDDQLKIGKALAVLTKDHNDVISRGYHVIGLALCQKFAKALDVLDAFVGQEKGGDVVCQKHLDQLTSALESLETHEGGVEVKGPGHKRLVHSIPTYTASQKEVFVNRLKDVKARMEGEGRVAKEVDFEGYFGGILNEAKGHEQAMVEEQKKLYEEWTEKRELMMQQQVAILEESQEKRQMAQKILELKQSEERLRFYEQRVQMNLELSRQPAYPKVKENVAEELYVPPPGERRADRKK